MCRLLGLYGTPPQPVWNVLDGFYPLCTEGVIKCTMKSGHLDGWGISGFSQSRAVYFGRSSEPADTERKKFLDATQKAQASSSSIIIAHLRKASAGSRDIRNTHPFHHRDWVFAHNGTIFNVSDLPLVDAEPHGQTDSERFMLWLLEQVRNEDDVTQALSKTLAESRSTLRYSSLTFVLSDGKSLWAYREIGNKNLELGETREEREKYYTLYRTRLPQGAQVVCSEPIPAISRDWTALESGTLVVFSLQKPEGWVVKV